MKTQLGYIYIYTYTMHIKQYYEEWYAYNEINYVDMYVYIYIYMYYHYVNF